MALGAPAVTYRDPGAAAGSSGDPFVGMYEDPAAVERNRRDDEMIAAEQAAFDAALERRRASQRPADMPPGAVGMDEVTPGGGSVDLGELARRDIADEEAAAARNLGVAPNLGIANMALGAAGQAGGEVDALAAALSRRVGGIRRHPLEGATKEYASASAGARQRAAGGARQQMEAEAELARSEAAYYLDEHARMSAEAQAQADVEQVRREQADAELEGQRFADQQIREAADSFMNAPEVDPQRGWSNRTAGQRFAGVLAAGAFGAAGWSPDQVLSHINRALDMEVDASKFNAALRERKFGARVEVANAGARRWQMLREKFGDDRMAELAQRAALLEVAKARLAKIRTGMGVPLTDAAHVQQSAAIDEQIAKHKLEMATLRAKVAPRFVSRPAVSGPGRQVGMLLLKDALGRRGKLTEQGLTLAGQAAGDASKESIAQAKISARSRGNDGLSDKDVQLLQAHQDNVSAATELGTLVDDFIRDYGEGVPGRGISSATDWATDPNARADAQTRLSQMADAIGRLKSGAAITTDEQEKFEEWLHAGFGDERLLQNLRNIKRMGESRIQTAESALPKRLRAHFRHVDEEIVPELDPNLSSATGRANRQEGDGGVVDVDEDD